MTLRSSESGTAISVNVSGTLELKKWVPVSVKPLQCYYNSHKYHSLPLSVKFPHQFMTYTTVAIGIFTYWIALVI